MLAIRKKLFENLPLKLLSLLFAIILYLMVSVGEGQDVIEVNKRVQLVQTGDPPGLARVGDIPSEIEVRIKGRERDIDQTEDNKLIYTIDVSNISEPDVYTYRIYKRKIDAILPRGVVVTSIEPSQISIEFERLIDREVAVEITTVGMPAPGYQIDPQGLIARPKTVTIQGPHSLISSLLSLPTEPVDISGRSGNVQLDVGVDTTGRPIVVKGQSLINVLVEIKPRIISRTFEKVPIEVINSELSAEIDPAKLDLTLSGPQLDLERLKAGDVRLVIDASGLKAGVVRLRPKLVLRLPEDAIGNVSGPERIEQVQLKLKSGG